MNKELEHVNFLLAMKEVFPKTAAVTFQTFWVLWAESNFRLLMPATNYCHDGLILQLWDKGIHHLELEVCPKEGISFFYRNRKEETCWYIEYLPGQQFPNYLLDILPHFYRKGLTHD